MTAASLTALITTANATRRRERNHGRGKEIDFQIETGGDKIAARFMRQDFFEYTPQFKLLIAGNHKPGLRSVDEAIRQRFNLIPFTVTIPPKERDEKLPEKLKAELPGILQWMIDGCASWRERGLAPPEIVTAATAEYLNAEDAIAAWLDEEAQRDPCKKTFATISARSGHQCNVNRTYSCLWTFGHNPQNFPAGGLFAL